MTRPPENTNHIHEVLSAYHNGDIGWREALYQLQLDDFQALHALLVEHGLGLYQPSPEASRKTMQQLDQWLYDDDEI